MDKPMKQAQIEGICTKCGKLSVIVKVIEAGLFDEERLCRRCANPNAPMNLNGYDH